MRIRKLLVVVGLVAVLAVGLLAGRALEKMGNPDSTGDPASTSSYTLEDIYNRLASGADGTQAAFAEPTVGPGTGTMFTLDQIMGEAPVRKDATGATTADVVANKDFWGLTGGQWGLRTGTMPVGSNVSGPNGSKTFSIPNGYYSGKTATANDTALVAGNIAQGANIFGVDGSAIAPTGDATAGDVLDGKTFSNDSGAHTGTMPDNEGDNASTAQGRSSEVNYFTAPRGYYDGDDRVSATDAEVRALAPDITAENVKSGMDIFGVTGELHGGCTCTATETRWCDNGDGTVTDLTTCLVWLKDASWGGEKPWGDCTEPIDDAHTRAGLLKAADYTWLDDGSVYGDWRLPTLEELKALTTGTEPVSSGDMRKFSGVQSTYYWSSTTRADLKSNVMIVRMDDGSLFSATKSYGHTCYVWPVRGP